MSLPSMLYVIGLQMRTHQHFYIPLFMYCVENHFGGFACCVFPQLRTFIANIVECEVSLSFPYLWDAIQFLNERRYLFSETYIA